MKAGLILLFVSLMVTGRTYSCCDADSVETYRSVHRKFPNIFSLQYAGNIGFLSAGAGYSSRKESYQLIVLYGYSPPAISNSRIHTLTARNVFHFYTFPLQRRGSLIPYGGLALSMELAGRSFFFQPGHMPKSYYDFPRSIHIIASAGLKRRLPTRMKPFRDIEFFAEATTVDAWLWYKSISNDVRLHHIVSASMGLNLLRR